MLATPRAETHSIDSLRAKARELQSLTSQVQQMSLQAKEATELGMERMAESPFLCQGRLTLESNTPISNTDQVARNILYFTPHQGSRVTLFNGTTWAIYPFTQRSLTLTGLTNNTNYDVFIYYLTATSTLTLELTAWSSATARATALVKQDGVYVRSGATDRRYLGTIRTTSTTTTEDSLNKRFVWNYFNRVRRPIGLSFTADSWTYGISNAWRSASNSTTLRVEFVSGENEVPVNLRGMALLEGTTTLANVSLAFSLDATNFQLTSSFRGTNANTVIRQQTWTEMFEHSLGIGYHFLQAVEWGDNTARFYGDAGADVRVQGGILGTYEG